MPDVFDLKPEYFSSSALIIDEVGELPTLLVDELINLGCKVFYFGKENRESFSYLDGKNSFSYLQELNSEEFKSNIDYLFYFPCEFINNFQEFISLGRKFSPKSIICSQVSFSSRKVFLNFIKDSPFNLKILFYDAVFGPRITQFFLGSIIYKLIQKQEVVIEGDSTEEIFSIFSKDLIKKTTDLIFSLENENKVFLVQPLQKTTLLDISIVLKEIFPDAIIRFSGVFSERKLAVGEAEKIKIDYNLSEKIIETREWFERHPEFKKKDDLTPFSLVSEEIFPKEANPSVSSQKPQVEEKKQPPQISDFPTEVTNFSEIQGEIFFNKQESLEPESPDSETQTVVINPPEIQIKSSSPETENPDIKTEKFDNINQSDSTNKQLKSKKFSLFKKITLFLFFPLFLSLFFFIFPILIATSTNFLAFKKFTLLEKQIKTGEFQKALDNLNSARSFLTISQKTFNIFSPFLSLFGLSSQINTVDKFLNFQDNLATSLFFGLQSSLKMVDFSQKFLAGESYDLSSLSSELNTDLALAYEKASLAQSFLDPSKPIFLFFKKEDYFREVQKFLPQIRDYFQKGQKISLLIPQILGQRGVKNYLVLFQNNMELRPTGGFIGSYGILRLENGKLISFEVYDVYQADGQLKGHVEPPAKLKQYLGEATWYLRDSNWDPDFPSSAQVSQWFLEKETQTTVDGTIALTLETAKNILEAIGEIKLSDYNEKITANNLFQKAEYHAELGTFPGSTQKKEFLASLASEIFEEIIHSDREKLFKVGKSILDSLEKKEILIYFNDPELEKKVAELKWEGGIRDFQKNLPENVFTDYLMINEANVGINKANYYLQRKIDHEITFSPTGQVQGKLLLIYENLSPSNDWPVGNYKAYLRIYFKKGSVLSQILLDDPQAPGFWKSLENTKIDEFEEHDKKIYGFLLEVPFNAKRKVEIDYQASGMIKLESKPAAYLLMVQKQPGSYPSIYNLTLSYPNGFIPIRVLPEAQVGEGKLVLSSKLDKDLVYQLDYSFSK